MNRKQLQERFTSVLTEHHKQGSVFMLALSADQVMILHGLIALAMDHPGVKCMEYAWPAAEDIRRHLLGLMRDMGLTEEEVQQLDRLRE